MRKVRYFAFAMCVMIGLSRTAVFAQEESTAKSTDQPTVELPSDVHVTPEMWMYLHEYRRHQDPKESIRAKAEFRANQRQSRLASQRWYGHTKARPVASATPYFSSYGTHWVGLPWDYYRWSAYRTTHRFYQNADPDYYYYPPLRVAGHSTR